MKSGTSRLLIFFQRTALLGFALFAIFAPHSVAGAELSLAFIVIGWLGRVVLARQTGFRRTALDLPVFLFLSWTVLSSVFSVEPGISIPKLQPIWVVSLFYLTHSLLERRPAILIAVLMIASGLAGVIWGAVDLARGRGVLIEELSADSPFHQFQLGPGDAVWRVNGIRVDSVDAIDRAIRQQVPGVQVSVSVIARGEHGERTGLLITHELQSRGSPSGIKGAGPTHRFRASGWTRHYETFAEIIQILAQLSLGFAIAFLRRGSRRTLGTLALCVTAILAVGVAMTAMRTVLVALVIGGILIALRSVHGKARFAVAGALVALLAIGAISIWRTRSTGALALADYSSNLRWTVARVGLSRVFEHPLLGHGMDSMKAHWTEWGFPGQDMIHLHSTPLQIAFDRGLPALGLWLWLIGTCWWLAFRAERMWRETSDAGSHGLMLGALGGLTGVFASSLVNYNLGDAEVTLVFWWLMGLLVVFTSDPKKRLRE